MKSKHKMTIPFHKAHVGSMERTALLSVLDSGWLTMGPRTFEFEEKFREFTGAQQAVAVSSCTAALHLSLCAAGIGPGDEVILPAMTFAATAGAVIMCGATPILCDVREQDATIDPAEIETRITSKTRALIPVHFGGNVCDMDTIMSIARSHGLTVIEDAAHALPAWYKGRIVGSIGDYTCFSFYATKPLTTGEGGMITTHNHEAAERMRRLRLHGISKEAWNRYSNEGHWAYDVVEPGYKCNMTDLQAALGIVQLSQQNELRNKRYRIKKLYDDALDVTAAYMTRADDPAVVSACHLYVVMLDPSSSLRKDEALKRMSEHGVGTSVHYIPLYRFPAFARYTSSWADYPVCERLFAQCFSVPLFPDMSDEQIEYVTETLITITENSNHET